MSKNINTGIVSIDFGDILSELENKKLKLCFVEGVHQWGLALEDYNKNLYQMETYYSHSWLTRLILDSSVVKFERFDPTPPVEDWEKQVWGVSETKQFIETTFAIEHPDIAKNVLNAYKNSKQPLDVKGFVEVDGSRASVEHDLEGSASKYNKIVKCNFEGENPVSYRECFLLTGEDIEVDGGFEVDLTGFFCFNTEFKSFDREVVAVVNSVDDVLDFCDQRNIYVPSGCLKLDGCLSVGACCDYVLNNELVVFGWEEDLSEEVVRKVPLDKQVDRAAEKVAAKIKPDCPLIGQDGNIFNLMSIASKTLRKNDMAELAKEMCDRIRSSGSYDEALCILGEYVNITSVHEKSGLEL